MLFTKPQKGSVLVFSLIVLSIVLSTALSITAVNVSNRKSAASTAQSVQSFQTADTATEKVMKAIYNGNYASLYLLYHDGLGSMACGENTPSDGDPAPLILSDIVSQGVGLATVTFFDTNGARLVDCTATNWRDTLARVKVEGSGSSGGGAVRVIEVGIAPLSSMAWGANSSGQLGDGTTTDKHTPVSTVGGSKWESVSAAKFGTGAHVLAVRADGTLWAWGNGANGRLGRGSNADASSPIQVGTDNTWESVSAGESHSLGIKTDHSMWAWGNGADHRLGTGNSNSQDVPVRIGVGNNCNPSPCPTEWKVVSAGKDFSLAIGTNGTDDTLWSWGNNANGRLGNGENGHEPGQVTCLSACATGWKAVSAGASHVLAIRSNGSDDNLYTWGQDDYGQLGNGATTGTIGTPSKIGSDTWASVAAGNNHSLGIKSDNTLWAWGRDNNGQVGNGSPLTDVPSEVLIDGDPAWKSVSGSSHSLALTMDGRIYAWGNNGSGQLGNGSTISQPLYQEFSGGGTWQSISAGEAFSIGVRE